MLWLSIGMGLLAGLVAAQSERAPKFLDRAVITRDGSQVTVVANDSLPLLQAINAVRLEYGWQIDWESAPGYSHFDLADDTAPKWRLTHPSAKGVTRPAGGSFTASFPEPNRSGVDEELLALTRLVEEYNATDNPGRYAVHSGPGGLITIVGNELRDETGAFRRITPLLDTPITLPKAERSVDETIDSILAALDSATGKKVVFAELSHSLLMSSKANIGGEKMKARELLEQALASTGRPIQYDLCFNADIPTYILSTSIAMRTQDDELGGHKLVPVDHTAKP